MLHSPPSQSDGATTQACLGVTDFGALPCRVGLGSLQPAVGNTLVDDIPVGHVPSRKVAVAVAQFACGMVSPPSLLLLKPAPPGGRVVVRRMQRSARAMSIDGRRILPPHDSSRHSPTTVRAAAQGSPYTCSATSAVRMGIRQPHLCLLSAGQPCSHL